MVECVRPASFYAHARLRESELTRLPVGQALQCDCAIIQSISIADCRGTLTQQILPYLFTGITPDFIVRRRLHQNRKSLLFDA